MSTAIALCEAIRDLVHDGDKIALEGFTHLIPFAAGNEIMRQRKRNLTLIRMTPDVIYDFPDMEFVLFFVFHSGIIAAVLYMTFGLGWRPYPASLPRVIAWTLVYAAIAGLFDWILDANYAFLRAKPPFASVFNFMPAWPWYIPLLIVLGLLSCLIYYAPFYVWDRTRALRASDGSQSLSIGRS